MLEENTSGSFTLLLCEVLHTPIPLTNVLFITLNIGAVKDPSISVVKFEETPYPF